MGHVRCNQMSMRKRRRLGVNNNVNSDVNMGHRKPCLHQSRLRSLRQCRLRDGYPRPKDPRWVGPPLGLDGVPMEPRTRPMGSHLAA
jgi:hypothetical protein